MTIVKNVLLTGGTRGIGLAIARYLAKNDYQVFLTDISDSACSVYGDLESVEMLVAELNDCGSKSCFWAGDLTKEAEATNIVEKAVEHFGEIHALINCAGGDIGGRDLRASGGKIKENNPLCSTEDFFSVFDRNFLTCFNSCRAVAPLMKSNGQGKIVNFSSVSAGFGPASETAYSVAKAAVVQFSRSLASYLRPNGVNVNCIAPGATRSTRFLSTITDRSQHDTDRIESNSWLESTAEPTDVVKVVEFLISEKSDFISGQVLRVDGGQFTSPI